VPLLTTAEPTPVLVDPITPLLFEIWPPATSKVPVPE
jgi:hypothetical protein